MVTPLIMELPQERKCICLSLVLSFFVPSCLTLWNWGFYYFLSKNAWKWNDYRASWDHIYSYLSGADANTKFP